VHQGYVQFYDHQWRYVTLTDEQLEKYNISPNTALNLYQLMKDTHEILVKHKINYWIEGGTLLGAVRHKGIIPFDDDLDIGVMHDDEIRLQDALIDLQELGYKLSFKNFYSLCNKVCIDIFIFHIKDNKVIHTNINARNKYPNEYFYIEELFPLKKYQFGKIEVWGPQQFRGNLDRVYPEWDKYAVIQQPHNYHISLSNIERKTKLVLTPQLLQPAMPLGPLEDRVK
jgi:phosphorylcholine metabolism protein LicD